MRRRCTYRVQLSASFGFDHAAEVADYLAALGVSHLYTSPGLQAAAGSMHGYDVIDHSRLSDELGGEPAQARMIAALARAGLGHVIDVVPNHMSIAGRANRWWWDVLRNGLASEYACYFDVDWEPPEARLRNTLLLPVLADQYGRALERGEIQLRRDGTAFTVRYKDHEFPIEPRSLVGLFRIAAQGIRSERLAFIADALELLPAPTETNPQAAERRRRDDRMATELLQALLAAEPDVGRALDRAVDACNANPDSLDRLLEQQNYRLAWWQAAERDLGYRRFFDVNTLIGLRMEVPEAFEAAHRVAFDLLRAGAADGLRIDHVDGIQDPRGYLERLREQCPRPGYIVVEKILLDDERLPDAWPVEGTTGYDFLNLLGGLFINPRAEAPLTQFYATFAGMSDAYADVAHEKRLLVLREGLGSDVNRLSELLLQICERHRRHRDYTRHMLTEAVRELLASFPVYRTYVRPDVSEVSEFDRRALDAATRDAKRRRPDLDGELFDFLRGILTLGVRGELETRLVNRFQQLSTAVMAKGVEDTAFYCFNRFVAVNEVGGNPARFGVSPAEFHARMGEVQQHHPQTMSATATHDSKRGEDVRARLAVITECPGSWTTAVQRWSEHNERCRTGDLPDRNTEYLYYQTLVGAWPVPVDRMLAYMEKATREAKTHTSWTSPHEKFETALKSFIERTLTDPDFITMVREFVDSILEPGRVVSLAQTLVKLTAPGVPDLYQGTELWSLSLVDPDNRRPVDYGLRRRLLAEVSNARPEQVLARMDEGVPKLWMIQRALSVEAKGCYQPLAAEGEHAEHVLAFGRGGNLVTIVPRLTRMLNGGWGDTAIALPDGQWRNVFTGERHSGRDRLAHLFARFPVALLARES